MGASFIWKKQLLAVYLQKKRTGLIFKSNSWHFMPTWLQPGILQLDCLKHRWTQNTETSASSLIEQQLCHCLVIIAPFLQTDIAHIVNYTLQIHYQPE